MQISTVKRTPIGYLVNGIVNVPNDPKNKEFRAVQLWIDEGNTPDPEFSDSELLANAKKVKCQEINNQRDSLTNRPVSLTISGTRHTFDTGIESRLNIANTYIALGSSDTIEWVTEENRIIDLTPTQVLQICTIIMNNKSSEVKLARRRKDAVNALTSVSAVEDYDITTTTFE